MASLTDLRRRMLPLGTPAGTDEAFARYARMWLGGDTPADEFPQVKQGFDAGWTAAVQAVDRLIEETRRAEVPPCPCECNSGGFCGGCGHGGCGFKTDTFARRNG